MEIVGLYKRKIVCILLLTVIVLFAGAGNSFARSGKVISVTDGDTIVVLTEDNIRQNVRLASIDAPERNQYFGNTAKQFL